MMYKLIYEDFDNPDNNFEIIQKSFDKNKHNKKNNLELVKVIDMSKNITIFDVYKGIYAR